MEATSKTVSLSKDIRIKRSENYDTLEIIKRKISDEIITKYTSETTALREENDNFLKEERAFFKKAEDILMAITPANKIKVSTQVGKGSVVINNYIGHIENFYHGEGYFNMIDQSPEPLFDGKPFSIGFSCLLSIEVIEGEINSEIHR